MQAVMHSSARGHEQREREEKAEARLKAESSAQMAKEEEVRRCSECSN
jgi:hypothetical protein